MVKGSSAQMVGEKILTDGHGLDYSIYGSEPPLHTHMHTHATHTHTYILHTHTHTG